MKSIRVGLVFLLLLLAILVPVPGFDEVAPLVRADHTGEMECRPSTQPLHDGVIEPGEYDENFFDPATKILVYFECSEDANRTMHIGMVTPWEGWTEVRLQSLEVWNGDFNAVRVTHEDTGVQVLDGHLSISDPSFVHDLDVGGSSDIADPVALRKGDHYVYEFAVPLSSDDVFDCQLSGLGSFFFQLAYATYSEGEAVLESNPRLIRFGTEPITGKFSALELSLPEGNPPLGSSEILVTVRDENNTPLPQRSLSVFVQTAFGFLELGSTTTNAQGIASVEYAPRDEGEYLIGAAFLGGQGYLASVEWLRLVVVVPAPDPGILPRDVVIIQAILVAVVGGIWAAYAYSFFSLRLALREPETQTKRDQNGEKPRAKG